MRFTIKSDYIRIGSSWNFSFFQITKGSKFFRICILSVWFELDWREEK